MAQEQQQWSRLCELCEHINFAAILTPRAYDKVDGTSKAIYRPELNGNGSSPIATWMSRKERKNVHHPPGSIKVRLPITKTAFYEDLSASESEDDDETMSDVDHERRAVVVVGDEEENDKECEDDRLAGEVEKLLVAELSDIEDDDDDEQVTGGDDVPANKEDDLDDDESIASISTWSGLSHFTENNLIDLNRQAAGNWSYGHGDLYYLGTIWDVRSRRRRCEFCKHLWAKMRNNPAVCDEYITKSRCVLKLMELNGRKAADPTEVVHMLNLTFIYGYKFGEPHEVRWEIRNPLVMGGTHRDLCELEDRLPAGQTLPFRNENYGEARWKHDGCNFELLKAWLSTCTVKHAHSPLKSSATVKIRLIDVEQLCLVEFDGANSVIPDFVTLSYVWGASKPRTMLRMSQVRQSKVSGFFGDDKDLNTTFRDSFRLCSNMGQKYLWIDALCIIQDDSNDKLTQIPQMREIYGRSLFTIVAAYGGDADAGLPRLAGKGGSKFKLELKDVRVQGRGSCKIYRPYNDLDIGFTENYIRGSPYLSRAWTFQEGLLAPRLMIFTQDKVYWECERCTWCDDTHWESDEVDFVGLRAIKGATPDDVWNDRFERHAYDMRASDNQDVVPAINSYAALVKEYSNRRLTWDDDVLYACGGVLAYIKEQEQSEFLFGLREKHFGNDLLFNYWTAIAPRFPNRTSTESGFPSWSWTAWKGSVQVANQARGNSYDLAENLIPCDGVRCFTLTVGADGSRSLRVINDSGGWKFEQGYIRRGEGIYDPTELSYEWSPTIGELEAPEDPQDLIATHSSRDLDHHVEDESTEDTKKEVEILVYNQDVSLRNLAKHPAFDLIQPSLHIVFKTFSTLVVVVLDYDDYVINRGNPIMGGTVMVRSEGVWGNKDQISRKVYACRKISMNTSSSSSNNPEPTSMQHHQHQEVDDACPCCGKDPKRKSIPEGYELGPYLGRLPALSTAWDRKEYLKAAPDGLYRMLWMNNNQLPMFGHLLCKPVSPNASPDGGDWDGQIMQRVSSVIGPSKIITKEQQARYCARWGTHILA